MIRNKIIIVEDDPGISKYLQAALRGRDYEPMLATDGKTAQITYEQIAAVCGDDVSTWGARMQFESDGAWKVYAVTVGQSK